MGRLSGTWQWGITAAIGAVLAGLLLLLALNTSAEVPVGPVFGRHTERVSVSTSGEQADAWTEYVSISANGRWVVFDGEATTLVQPDANRHNADVFVHDRVTGRTERVSVSSSGVQGNSESRDAEISADGRYVVFYSHASNLVRPDTNAACDVFLRDRRRHVTERISVGVGGQQTDGSCSFDPVISADGRYVAFSSDATNLVSPSTRRNTTHIYVRDRLRGVTELVSVGPDGAPANRSSEFPAISADGRFVAYHSGATNLVHGDTNGTADIFVYDRAAGRTERVSVSSDGRQGNRQSFWPVITEHGQKVAFTSAASTLVRGDHNGVGDVFVYNRATDRIRRISVGVDGEESTFESIISDISADGRLVAYSSASGKLVRGDVNKHEDVFVYSLRTGRTMLVSVARGGGQSYAPSNEAALSARGRHIVFTSLGSKLVRGDTNRGWDTFVRTR